MSNVDTYGSSIPRLEALQRKAATEILDLEREIDNVRQNRPRDAQRQRMINALCTKLTRHKHHYRNRQDAIAHKKANVQKELERRARQEPGAAARSDVMVPVTAQDPVGPGVIGSAPAGPSLGLQARQLDDNYRSVGVLRRLCDSMGSK
ncbi:hypothetical protein PG984_005364 [Apiospora sp. TS-2023a]